MLFNDAFHHIVDILLVERGFRRWSVRVRTHRITEVGVQCAFQFAQRQFTIFEYLFLDGIDGVAGIGYAECLRPSKVVNRPAFLERFTTADTVVDQC
ncbi:hypothetical protein ExPUPEC61_02349 [Escherichia coli]|nr:hypothetical protein ExPUPEC61_02349 [Escherichia coli]